MTPPRFKPKPVLILPPRDDYFSGLAPKPKPSVTTIASQSVIAAEVEPAPPPVSRRKPKGKVPFRAPLRQTDDKSASNTHTSAPVDQERIKMLTEEIQAIEDELGPESVRSVDSTISRHISLLHTYNEVRDAALGIMQKIAILECAPTKEIHERFGVPAIREVEDAKKPV